MDHSAPKKPTAHCRQVQARPPLLNCRENSKLAVLNHHVAKMHTTKAPDLPRHLSPTKNRSRAPQKQANQTLYSLSQHLKPTRNTLRPLRNARLSDISHPAQHNDANISLCILKSPRFQINRLRTTPIKQQINDRPSHLFSAHTPKPAPKRAPFSAKPKAHNTNKTGQTDRNPAQNHTTGTTQRPSPSKRASNAAHNAKSTTISRPNPSRRQEKSENSAAIHSVF